MDDQNRDENNVRVISPDMPDWPALLRHIYDPPRQLFMRGSWPPRFADGTTINAETKFLCVVGARRHSEYGREACKSLIAGLAGYNICIVSGLALGLDAIAHETALDVRIPTIAFPGSGLNREVLYPPRNVRLAKRIIDAEGALLSEFPLDMAATPWCFQQRNRLMAGISHAVLVIEAKRPSGTLITSKYARDYNRDVFAVPGDISSPLSEGPHMLISQGAALVRNSNDILNELGIEIRNESVNSIGSGIFGDTDEEKMLYHIVKDAGGSIHINELIRSCTGHLTTAEIAALISLMEINGVIREKNGVVRIARERG